MSELDDIRERTEGHTPGPWHRLNAKDVFTVSDERRSSYSGFQIADCAMDYALPDESEMPYEEQKQNAALVAAAPDLLRIATEQEAEIQSLRGSLGQWITDFKAASVENGQLRTERDRLRKENEMTIWIVDWFENIYPAQLEEAREYASRMLWGDKS